MTPSRNFKKDHDLVSDKEPKSTEQIDDIDGKNEIDEEAVLRDRLQQLEIEKRSWLKKKRLADLKRQIEIGERQLDHLKRQSFDVDQDRENLRVRFVNSTTFTNAGGIGSSILTTKSLRRMTSRRTDAAGHVTGLRGHWWRSDLSRNGPKSEWSTLSA